MNTLIAPVVELTSHLWILQLTMFFLINVITRNRLVSYNEISTDCTHYRIVLFIIHPKTETYNVVLHSLFSCADIFILRCSVELL